VEKPHLNAAFAIAEDDLEAHVTLLAPRNTPRVFHDPVLKTGFDAPADHQSGVVVICTALDIVKTPLE